MRCIEIGVPCVSFNFVSVINRNMRCIEIMEHALPGDLVPD